MLAELGNVHLLARGQGSHAEGMADLYDALRAALPEATEPRETEDEPVTGHVIGLSPTVWFSTLMIDVGSSDGVKLHDPVVDGDGLVGEVNAVTGGASKVRLITDHESRIGVRVVPAGLQALVKPTVGEPNRLVLGFINGDKTLHKGEKVVTSGWHSEEFEGRFPPNIPVGEITEASIVRQEAQEQVIVRPYADLRNLNVLQVLTGGSHE